MVVREWNRYHDPDRIHNAAAQKGYCKYYKHKK